MPQNGTAANAGGWMRGLVTPRCLGRTAHRPSLVGLPAAHTAPRAPAPDDTVA